MVNVCTPEEQGRFRRITEYLHEKYDTGLVRRISVSSFRERHYYNTRTHKPELGLVYSYGRHIIHVVSEPYLKMIIRELAYIHSQVKLHPADVNIYELKYSFSSHIGYNNITKEDVVSMASFLSKTQRGVWTR